MIRWKYVLSRLLVLAAVACLLFFSTASLIRWTLVYGGQSATGARVDVDSVAIDWSGSQILISGVEVADPNAPQRNLFIAERLVLDVDSHAALRRKLIVDDGQVDGVKLQSQRANDGRLEATEADDETAGGSMVEQAAQKGEAWLRSSTDKLQQDLEGDLHTVQLSKELRARWPAEYDQLRQRGQRIETEAKQLERQVKRIVDEPLENAHQIQAVLARADALRKDTLAARSHLSRLHEQMKLDQEALLRAKEHDQQYLRDKLQIDALDGQALSEYLLGPVWASRVETAIRWIMLTRDAVGDEQGTETVVPASRGYNVIFPGYHATPDFLIRRLGLNGTGSANGAPFTFQAELKDLTNQARRHALPATLKVVADGAVRLDARAILDRRGATAHDRFMVDLPAVPQPRQVLGDADQIAVEIEAGVARVQAEIDVIGRQIDGWIDIHQDQLRPKPILSSAYAKYLSAESLSSLADVNQLNARLVISGDLQRPSWRLQSDLGPQLAAAINDAMRAELGRRQQQLTQQGQQLVQSELDGLQQQLATEHQDLLAKLEIGDEQLQMIRSQLTANLDSPEQIIGRGKQLLELFK